MPDLTVIDGGDGGGRKFKENPHAIALWHAIHPTPAKTVNQIAERMGVTWATANNTLHHVRVWSDEYGWIVPHVQKGRLGIGRSYFPVMLDGSSPALRAANAQESLRLGGLSSTRTIASMSGHLSVAFEAAAENLPREKARIVRAAAAAIAVAERMALEALGNLAA